MEVKSFGSFSHIMLNGNYLSCVKNHFNRTEFCNKDDRTNRQRWTIEIDEYVYIKSKYSTKNGVSYVGCPNQSNELFLYTSKNKYTRWRLSNNVLEYCGEKFKDVTMVVARYNEPMDWVMAYQDIAIVYNKGYPLSLPLRTIPLENVGREGHTYLYHLMQEPSNTIFVQGDPFIHNETILYGIDNHDRLMDIQPLGLMYMNHNPPGTILTKCKVITDYGLHYSVLEMDKQLNYIGKSKFLDKGIVQLQKRYQQRFPCKTIIDDFLEKCQLPNAPEVIPVNYCGLFYVKKDRIESKEKYERILANLISYDSQGGENGYILERLWLHLFGFEMCNQL